MQQPARRSVSVCGKNAMPHDSSNGDKMNLSVMPPCGRMEYNDAEVSSVCESGVHSTR